MSSITCNFKDFYSYKYILQLNSRIVEIVSNLSEKQLLDALSIILDGDDVAVKIIDCIEFNYLDMGQHITLESIKNYI